jgi:hypothetical protein
LPSLFSSYLSYPPTPYPHFLFSSPSPSPTSILFHVNLNSGSFWRLLTELTPRTVYSVYFRLLTFTPYSTNSAVEVSKLSCSFCGKVQPISTEVTVSNPAVRVYEGSP